MRLGQRCHDLAQRRADGLSQTQIGVGPVGEEHEQCAGLVGRQTRDIGPVTGHQRDPAVAPALGVHRHTGRGQGLHVSEDRADGYPQSFGQVRGRQLPMGLQQQEEGQLAIGLHGARILDKHANH